MYRRPTVTLGAHIAAGRLVRTHEISEWPTTHLAIEVGD